MKARRAGKEPPAGQVGFSYMLGGEDWTASNVDPAATEPPPGEDWVKSGPHVMILNPGDLAQGYPNPGKDPDTSQA